MHRPSHPQLSALRPLREAAHASVWSAMWDEAAGGALPCVATSVPLDRRAAAALERLEVEARALGLLAATPGVPRLLHADLEAGLLVRDVPRGVPWPDAPAEWRTHAPNVLRIALRLVDLLEVMHAAGISNGSLAPADIVFDTVTGAVTLTAFDRAVIAAGPADGAEDHRALGDILCRALNGQAIAPPLSAVIDKLRAPAGGYQSAHGLRIDLERCLAMLERGLPDQPFQPGEFDVRIRPAPPSRLFGREAELTRLGRAGHADAVVLIRGPAGVGKTALARFACDTLFVDALFIDDLHAADTAALARFEALALDPARRRGPLLGAWRDPADADVDIHVDVDHGNDPAARDPALASLLARLADRGVHPIDIPLTDLDDKAVRALVADVLDTPWVDVIGLAGAVHRVTAGNPFHVLDTLRGLVAAGRLSRPHGRWRWDEAAVRALPCSDNRVPGMLRELARVPGDLRQLVGVCACLGPDLEADLLAATLGVPAARIDALLQPLFQRDLLMPVGSAGEGRERRLAFRHERLRQAADVLLDDAEHARWHLDIARAMFHRGGSSRRHGERRATDAPNAFVVASHCLRGLRRVRGARERAEVFALLMDAAERAGAEGAAEDSLRFADGAAMLLAATADAGHEAVVRLGNARHRCLCVLLRYDEADGEFERLRAHAMHGEHGDHGLPAIAEAAGRQLLSLSGRSRCAQALELARDLLAALGIALPEPARWRHATAKSLADFKALLAQRGISSFDRLPPLIDARLLAATHILAGASEAGDHLAPHGGLWFLLGILRIGLVHGHAPKLPFALVSVYLALATHHNDGPLGYALARRGIQMLRHCQDPGAAALVTIGYVNHIGRNFDSYEESLELARRGYRLAVQAGDAVVAVYSFYTTLVAAMEAEPLDHLLACAGQAMRAAAAARNDGAAALVRLFDRLARCLIGDTRVPGRFDEECSESDARLIAADDQTAHAPAMLQARAAIWHGRWEDALRFARSGHRPGVKLFAPNYKWLYAMALARAMRDAAPAERAALSDEMAPLLPMIEDQARRTPMNTLHMWQLLGAVRAWAERDTDRAAALLRDSIDSARRHHRLGHLGLACELAAEFFESIGEPAEARVHLAEALRAYDAWGALGKARQLSTWGGAHHPALEDASAEAGPGFRG